MGESRGGKGNERRDGVGRVTTGGGTSGERVNRGRQGSAQKTAAAYGTDGLCARRGQGVWFEGGARVRLCSDRGRSAGGKLCAIACGYGHGSWLSAWMAFGRLV